MPTVQMHVIKYSKISPSFFFSPFSHTSIQIKIQGKATLDGFLQSLSFFFFFWQKAQQFLICTKDNLPFTPWCLDPVFIALILTKPGRQLLSAPHLTAERRKPNKNEVKPCGTKLKSKFLAPLKPLQAPISCHLSLCSSLLCDLELLVMRKCSGPLPVPCTPAPSSWARLKFCR